MMRTSVEVREMLVALNDRADLAAAEDDKPLEAGIRNAIAAFDWLLGDLTTRDAQVIELILHTWRKKNGRA